MKVEERLHKEMERGCFIPILWVLARAAGLEPTTDCLEGSCSIQLSYARVGY